LQIKYYRKYKGGIMENEMDTLTTDEKMLIMLLRTEKINTQRAFVIIAKFFELEREDK
tara:strand:- start:1181 stop:1354 length:174 start_codon:yes stop_codon:yes gene_type:complete